MMLSSSKSMSVMKGMGIGLAVGTAAAVIGSSMMTKSSKKACRKNAIKCMKSVENALNGMMK
ncbi:MAG: hypothetical protein IJD78_03615 [Clostridia bacterium]|nr:hypothetical protein [Clostridia bacterium]MBQ3006630.1 hypothetical protein [Clostridia bacterium]